MIIEKNGKPYAIPPFNTESATLKVKAAENAWNSKDPARVALALLKIPNGEIEPNSLGDAKK